MDDIKAFLENEGFAFSELSNGWWQVYRESDGFYVDGDDVYGDGITNSLKRVLEAALEHYIYEVFGNLSPYGRARLNTLPQCYVWLNEISDHDYSNWQKQYTEYIKQVLKELELEL